MTRQLRLQTGTQIAATPGANCRIKDDGFRAVCYVQHGRCNLVSRRGNLFTRFDELGNQVASALDVAALGDAILDGEVTVADDTGRPQFYNLLRRTRSPVYVAFGLLWLNGVDLRPLPLSERRRRLQAITTRRRKLSSVDSPYAPEGGRIKPRQCLAVKECWVQE